MRTISSHAEFIEIYKDRKKDVKEMRDGFKITKMAHDAKFKVAKYGATTAIRSGFYRGVNVAEFAQKTNLYLQALKDGNLNKKQIAIFYKNIRKIYLKKGKAFLSYEYLKMAQEVESQINSGVIFNTVEECFLDEVTEFGKKGNFTKNEKRAEHDF
jgi:hypothetical protein